MTKQIAILVGSLRKDSFNKKMAHQLMNFASQRLNFQIIEIGQLSLYNQDLDENPPPSWVEFREQIKECDGVLFVTPEYNRSIPGALKNAIDIGSRPYGHSVWDGKPGAVISVSPSKIGGFGANHHLRQTLVYLNVPCLQQPEAYIGGAAQLFNVQDEIQVEATREFLYKFAQAFADWVETLSFRSSKERSVA